MRRLLTAAAAIAVSLGMASIAPPAMANGTASSQATAAVNVAVGCTATGATFDGSTSSTDVVLCKNLFTGGDVNLTNNQYVPVMDSVIKISNSQSLFVGATEVTGLYTDTKTKTSGNSATASVATGTGGVYLRAVACPFTGTGNSVGLGACIDTGGALVTGTSYSFPGALCQDDNSGNLGCAPGEGVVLDQRTQSLSSTVNNCVTNVGGTNYTCTFDQTIELLLNTTSAHTVNFIFPNLGVGSWVVEIQAAVDATASASGGSGGGGTSAIAGAAFGLGSMTVNSVRLVNGFSF